jgi:hypothetical protein
MTLAPGTRIDSYTIVASLGQGGMGEVYRARDARLDRDVAIKILPRTFAEDPDRRTRFDREARVLASLNHPNIAQIYGAADADGLVAIVMELVEGEDLAARVARGPLTWSEAQPIARQLAEGLDAAHERGVVHRDLKPANIRITPDETVKILDFGLAKAVAGADVLTADPALSPTFTSPATHLGTIVGTAAYMAPEQAKGKAVDKRADIWAFGVVLFEMLTGRSPFGSDSAVESLGLVMTKEPDWSALYPSLPPRVVELLKRCLVKDPRGRLRDIGDAILLLTATDHVAPLSPIGGSVTRRSGVLLMAVLAVALAAAAAAVAWRLAPSAPVPLRRLDLPEAIARSRMVAISPDGRQVAYVAQGRIFVRRLDETDPRALTAAHPTIAYLVWSPDSRTLGFYAEGTIRTVPIAGGPVFSVTRVPGAGRITGIVWHPDGSILFAAWRDSLYRVAASGGTPEILLEVDLEKEVDFHEISLAPGGRVLVGVHLRSENAVRTELVVPGQNPRRTVVADDSTVLGFHYSSGMLLFLRRGTNQGLWAVRFAEEKLDLSEATLVAAGATTFSVSDEGTLVAGTEVPTTFRFEWVARDGSSANAAGTPVAELSSSFALSPEGDRVAFIDGRTQPALYVRDLATGADTRLTAEASGQNVVLGPAFTLNNPGWLPRGRVFYAKGPIAGSQLFAQRADGAGDAAALTAGSYGCASADGGWFAWLVDERGQGRVRFARWNGDALGEARTFTGTEKVDVRNFDLSPDGTLLAYGARDASQQVNVFVIEFPEAGARWQVTTTGGNSPKFSADGRELLFLSGTRNEAGVLEGRLMVMPLIRAPSLRLGVAKALLTGAATPSGFATARDGRLLVARPTAAGPAGDSRAVLVQNWPLLVK